MRKLLLNPITANLVASIALILQIGESILAHFHVFNIEETTINLIGNFAIAILIFVLIKLYSSLLKEIEAIKISKSELDKELKDTQDALTQFHYRFHLHTIALFDRIDRVIYKLIESNASIKANELNDIAAERERVKVRMEKYFGDVLLIDDLKKLIDNLYGDINQK